MEGEAAMPSTDNQDPLIHVSATDHVPTTVEGRLEAHYIALARSGGHDVTESYKAHSHHSIDRMVAMLRRMSAALKRKGQHEG